MTKRITESAEIAGFREAGDVFCRVVTTVSAQPVRDSCTALLGIVHLLSYRALYLPDISSSDAFQRSFPHTSWKRLYETLRTYFGRYDVYWEVFDPHDHARRLSLCIAILVMIGCCTACSTTGHVGQWEKVTLAMPKEEVHALLGKPRTVITREQWDVAVRKPDGSITLEAALLLSRSLLSQFETLEFWTDPRNGGDLSIFFSRKDKVLGKQPYNLDQRESSQQAPPAPPAPASQAPPSQPGH